MAKEAYSSGNSMLGPQASCKSKIIPMIDSMDGLFMVKEKEWAYK